MAHHDLYEWLVLAASSTGVATLAGAVVGFWRKTSAEHRSQAEAFLVYTEVDGVPHLPTEQRTVSIVFSNRSDRIVSQVVLLHHDGAMEAVGVVPPGERKREEPDADEGLKFWPHPVACMFRDASGRSWLRTDEGRLYGRVKVVFWRTLRAKRVRCVWPTNRAAEPASPTVEIATAPLP